MASPPTGTVTFLFTDLEGSTKLWEHDAQAMQAALARHWKRDRSFACLRVLRARV
jgi:class 3 adenylate cyclase